MKIKNKIRIIVVATVSLILIAALTAVALPSDRHASPAPTEDESAVEVRHHKNILFMGLDAQSGLCDVIMLINLNLRDNTATVAQIPRDTFASYTESSYKKLNGAYNALGGAEQTARWLERAMGIEIHHYACIGLDTLGNIVDAVGGVDIDIPRRMYYNDPEQGLCIDLDAGRAHLDGEGAKQFVRFRSGYADGDLGRIDAQKLFLAAFAARLARGMTPALAIKLSQACDGVETDLSISELMLLAARALDVHARDISVLTLPGEVRVATQSGASYFSVSAVACERVMKQYFGARSEFDAEKLLLNGRYKSFSDVYSSDAQVDVLPLDTLMPSQ